MNIDRLFANGRQEFPMESRILLDKIMRDLVPIIHQPYEERKGWMNHELPDVEIEDEPDSGLLDKTKAEGKDPKFYLHYRPLLLEQLANAGVDMRKYFSLLKNLHGLYERCRILSENIIVSMSQQPEMRSYNLVNRLYSVPQHRRHTLRILYYLEGHRVMAKPHPDKNFLTLHVADSRPGLHFCDDHQLVTFRSNHVLAFTGLKASILTEKALPDNVHYVINDQLDNTRMSCVFFTHVDIGVEEKIVRDMVKQRGDEMVPIVEKMFCSATT